MKNLNTIYYTILPCINHGYCCLPVKLNVLNWLYIEIIVHKNNFKVQIEFNNN